MPPIPRSLLLLLLAEFIPFPGIPFGGYSDFFSYFNYSIILFTYLNFIFVSLRCLHISKHITEPTSHRQIRHFLPGFCYVKDRGNLHLITDRVVNAKGVAQRKSSSNGLDSHLGKHLFPT